eukprot:CAMPEP_0170563998 /NCGR_PEP_ID=MMETSP0211-20121228/70256_1 /TAXON_ID=311385 /ORGANISM="Pseudokeronopsis sp., Strain OXSARD2" /LENGTH=39 /DNA_ID= /DNA_START= /DNA_END= /DNA_ORIENTATION=
MMSKEERGYLKGSDFEFMKKGIGDELDTIDWEQQERELD